MKNIDALQVLSGHNIESLGIPVVIVAVSFTDDGSCICERYLFFVNRAKQLFFDEIVVYDRTATGNNIVGQTASFINEFSVVRLRSCRGRWPLVRVTRY